MGTGIHAKNVEGWICRRVLDFYLELRRQSMKRNFALIIQLTTLFSQGFVSGAIFNVILNDKIGFGKVRPAK